MPHTRIHHDPAAKARPKGALVAHANDRTAHVDAAVIESHLAKGEVSTREPAWKDLWIGQEQFQVEKIYGPLSEASRSAPRK